MAILKIAPFEVGNAKSGVSISQGEVRGRCFYRITLSGAAQRRFFNRALDPKEDALALLVTDMPDTRALMGVRIVPVDDASALPLAAGVKGSVNARASCWRPAKGKRPSMQMQIINEAVKGGGFSVRLPEWAMPEASRKPDINR